MPVTVSVEFFPFNNLNYLPSWEFLIFFDKNYSIKILERTHESAQ